MEKLSRYIDRFVKTEKRFFPELIFGISGKKCNPNGRFEWFVSGVTTIIVAFLIMFIGTILIGSISNDFYSYDAIELMGCIAILFCLISCGRFNANRIADLRLGFGDESILIFSPIRFSIFIFLGICSVAIAYFCVDMMPFIPELQKKFFISFVTSKFPKETIDYFSAKNLILLFLSAIGLAIFYFCVSCLFFPSKTLNIFENFVLSNKIKERVFFLFVGFLFLSAVWFGNHPEGLKKLLLVCEIIAFAILAKNFYVRVLCVYMLYLLFKVFDISFLLFAIFLISCRKNFLLSIIPLIGMYLPHDSNAWLILVSCYFLLVFEFDFGKKRDRIYALLWSLVIAIIGMSGAIFLEIPTMVAILEKFSFFSFVFCFLPALGLVYLGSKTSLQVICIVCLYGALSVYRMLSLSFFNDLPLIVPELILFALLLWVFSNKTDMLGAYKLAICSILFTLLGVNFIGGWGNGFAKTELIDVSYFLVCTLLFLALSYLLKRIQTPFSLLVNTATMSSLFVSSLIIGEHFFIFDIEKNTLNILFSLCNLVMFAVSFYVLYKERNRFDSKLIWQKG